MDVRLVVAKGADEGSAFQLAEGETKVIGRSPRADIVLHDDGISRQHCRARVENGACWLVDLNSKNGTSMNGRRIAGEVALNAGDTVTLGFSSLDVHVTPAGEDSSETAIEKPITAQVIEEDEPLGHIDAIETVERPAAAPAKGQESVMGAFEQFLDLPSSAGQQAQPPSSALELSIEPIPEAAKPKPQADRLIGRVIAGYRIEAFLRQEDISRVYAALQLSMERKVCMKVLSPDLTDDTQAVHRFITAARSAGKLSHPNIVQVYDAGEEDGVNFLTIELVDGTTLREHLHRHGRNRALDLAEAIDIVEQVGDALAYAHGQSVVHGNITPDNIYITPHNVAKLADLGFSKNLAESGIERPSRFGEQRGDLYFTAPEQLADPHSVTPKADVYGLGAVMFVMLTGHMPFRGNSAQEILERVRAGRRETVRRLRKEVPVELGGFVDRAMALKSENRYDSAARFLDDLRQLRARLSL